MDSQCFISSDEAKTIPIDELYQNLETSASGLAQEVAQKRLETCGLNQIEEHKSSKLLTFLLYFWGPIPWMIEIAAILSSDPSDDHPPSAPERPPDHFDRYR